MPATDIHSVIDAVWRIESARIIAGLARYVRDVGLAEDLAQDALVAALEQWPQSGIPDNPGAWPMATAKDRGGGSARPPPATHASRPSFTVRSATTCSRCCSRPAIRCCPPKPGRR